jgi:hypothetical protein
MNYEEEIVHWSGYPRLGSVPFRESPDAGFVATQAGFIAPALRALR